MLIAFLIFIWILAINIFSGYVIQSSEKNWIEISQKQDEDNLKYVSDIIRKEIEEVNFISDKINSDTSVITYLEESNIKRGFETILNYNLDELYQIEIYNRNLEIFAFNGRQLQPEYFLLQKALSGQKFTNLKNIGFYTYLIIYAPLKSENNIIGVSLSAKLIDIKFQLKNQFFPNFGITQTVNQQRKINLEIINANPISGKIEYDSLKYQNYLVSDIYGIQGALIGKVLISKFDPETYKENVTGFSNKIISILGFLLSVILIWVLIILLQRIKSDTVKILIFPAGLIFIRYLLLYFKFPAATFQTDIFSPSYFATPFGFGLFTSIGELFITSLFFLILAIYSIVITYRNYRAKLYNDTKKPGISITKIFFSTVLYFIYLYIFGLLLERIITDSNLNFFDRANIVPGLELFIVQFSILIISFTFLILFTSSSLYIFQNSLRLVKSGFYKKYYPFIYLTLMIIINHLTEMYFTDLKVDYLLRLAIIISTSLLAIYISYKSIRQKDYKILNLKNLSFLILICIGVLPFIILSKVTSQETKYVELIATKLAEDEDEKINFTITNELLNLSSNPRIEKDMIDKNLSNQLSFYLWAESKLNSESFSSALIILDTNKKVISDFNINDAKINTNKIVDFLKTNFFDKGYNVTVEEIYKQTDTLDIEETDIFDIDSMAFDESGDLSDTTDEFSPLILNNIAILQNPEEKFYVGIAPIEKLELKETQFAKLLGYLVIAVHKESKNLLFQTSAEIFRNYSQDNILEKLISKPVITEYSNDEIISSNNFDIAKSTVNSLDIFREYLKNSQNNSSWRIETINNEKYRTFYFYAGKSKDDADKVYSVSIKRDDLKTILFFYLKYVLFMLSIVVIIYLIIAMIYLSRLNFLRRSFKTKIFISFFFVSVLPIILLAIYTRSFIIDKNEQDLKNQIVSDLNLLNESLKGINFSTSFISNQDSVATIKREFLTRNISQIDKNFNLFLRNRLISTTNEELYKSDLLDTRVDAEAVYNILLQKSDLFISNQDIGKFSYLVGYKPLRDSKNDIAGIISSQLVYRQNEINEELTETLTFIFGIYFIVIIALLIFVGFLTDKISDPVIALKEVTEKISKGEKYKLIDVKRKDELGDLIRSFNKMTIDLERSKNELKKAERESAWRDIARRVAHEIKNPLTPMKLSIQFLAESFKSGKMDEFDENLETTKKLISDEIDKLNRIATEFSNFAKLPKRNYEEVYPVEILKSVISLYINHPDIKFIININDDSVKIIADKEELNRIFQNLIKNSIQAIIENGEININTFAEGEFFVVEISDNGIGMDEFTLKNLFEPNFSTKSSGMGLGLAITKKSLDDMKAEIEYESIQNKGTKVIVRFKKI
ncbi:MAG: cache domain-containing protein [Ignavibacteria bacterium]|nr:cache domain-containing protein [Ignavibacteria bacterium]